MLIYRIEFLSSKVLIRIEEKGAPRRILYFDTLKSLAKSDDGPSLAFLTKIHLRSPQVSRAIDTASFQIIELGSPQVLEGLKLLTQTGRLFYNNVCLQGLWNQSAKIHWKGDEGGLIACFLFLQGREIPIEKCEYIGFKFAILDAVVFSIETQVAWKFVELFVQGPIALQGAQKKQFLDEDPPIVWKEKKEELSIEVFPELVLSDQTGCFANLWMEYRGVGRVCFDDPSLVILGKKRKKIEENGWEKDLLELGFIRKVVGGSSYYCPGDKVRETLCFLLELGWKIVSSEGNVVLRQTSTSWDVREKNDQVAISGKVRFGSQEVDIKLLAKSESRLWIALESGSIGLLEKPKISSLEGSWEGDSLIIPRRSLHFVSSLLEGDDVKWEGVILKMVEGLRSGASLELALPDKRFHGKLLPYQQKGVDFLSFLQRWGFAALLADEMGLGKTVQVLAFFSRVRTNLPILVVAPSSLLYQWREEIYRFLPGASVYIHAGSSRLKDLPLDTEIVITSYAILRIDQDLLARSEFEVIVLDEANAIKTASTMTAKAAFRLNGRFKISLTGTPIENCFEEIVSQFQFLMPDLKLKDFERLKGQIKPFILRRKKKEVEIDLPEKMELISWVSMTEEQDVFYHSYLSQVKEGLIRKVQADGIGSHRMEVLETILRLRQICADPRLVGEKIAGSKIDLLLSDIEGHNVLIYSQFTSMLGLVSKALEEKGKSFLYLDGSVSPEQRALLVHRFQTDPRESIFLLSLKAGGVGLNLTKADYVFLLDPWWNEAVEQQAIDRAHRMGQKNQVIAKRYLVPNSIEEKMLRLKEKKRGMAELLLEGEEFNWTEEDLLHLLS
jgi:superfamily II DNA or RNA helicase